MKENAEYMILLINDSKDKRIDITRDDLRFRGVLSVIVDSTHAHDYPEALAAFVIANSEDYLNTVSVRCGRIPLLVLNESGSRIYNKDVVFYDCNTYDSTDDFILGYLHEKYDFVPGNFKVGGLSIDGNTAIYGLGSIKLTPAEKNILMLLMVCRKKWVCEKNIESVCFGDKSKSCRVSVHICNLNKKFKAVIGREVILCKRGAGYMLVANL